MISGMVQCGTNTMGIDNKIFIIMDLPGGMVQVKVWVRSDEIGSEWEK